jgi:hypothetical protein
MEISDETRTSIFAETWQKLSWNEGRVFVHNMVDIDEVKQRKPSIDPSRRNVTLRYYLKNNGMRVQVCKRMFLSTTSLGEWSVR